MIAIHLRISSSHFVLERSHEHDDSNYTMRIQHAAESEASHEVPASVAQAIFERAHRARILAAPSEYTLAVGGTSKELVFDSGLNVAIFRWWQSPPHGWEELEGLAAELERAAFKLVPRYIPRGE